MPIDPAKTKIDSQWAHTSPLIACRFDPLGRFVFTSAEDNTIQRWELTKGEKTAWGGHDSWVFALGVTPDGATLISGGGDGRLIWWNAADAKPEAVRRVDAHQGWIRQLSISADGQAVATAGNDQKVRLWKVADGALLREFHGHENQVYSVLFHPAGTWVLSGDLLGFVRQWDVSTGASARQFEAKDLHSYNGGQGVHFGGIRAIALSRDGKQMACGGLHKAENPLGAVHEPLMVIFDWESQKVVQSCVADGAKGSLWRLVQHPEGLWIGASGGSSGGFLHFWKSDQAKESHRFQLPNLARDFDLNADSSRFATTHYDKHLRIGSFEKG
ncbi:MAG: hypothetical protein U1A77_17125 [Pirellulales bacterium]